MDELPQIDTGGRPSQRTVESLGPSRHELKPSQANQGAGIILSILMVGGGGTLAWFPARAVIQSRGRLPLWAEEGMSWAAVGILGILGIGLALGGILLFRWVLSMYSFRLHICHDGFYYRRRGKSCVYAWEEIVAVEETVLHEHLPVLRGVARYALPTKQSRSYVVRRCDGERFLFGGDVIKDVALLAGVLQEEAERRVIPWIVKEEWS